MPKWLQTNWRWLVWTAVSLLLYVLLFFLLYADFGPPGALLIVPVFLINDRERDIWFASFGKLRTSSEDVNSASIY